MKRLGHELVVAVDALGVRRDLASRRTARTEARTCSSVSSSGHACRPPVGDRRCADRLDRARRERRFDRGARRGVVARLAEAEQRRDRLEPVADARRQLGDRRRAPTRAPARPAHRRELDDHARLGRRVGDALDDDLMIVDRSPLLVSFRAASTRAVSQRACAARLRHRRWRFIDGPLSSATLRR